MNSTSFETRNRKLEQFFFMHDIQFDSWYRDRDGLTVWKYTLDAEGLQVLEEWRRIIPAICIQVTRFSKIF